MPVGNDVVDLRDPGNQPEALHPRFDRRVFGETDLSLLDACPDAASRHRLRWILWAARESAFKYVRQLVPRAVFRPRDVDVRIAADDESDYRAADGRWTGRLSWCDARVPEGRDLVVSFDVDARRVHAVVRAPGSARATDEVREATGILTPEACSSGVRVLAAEVTARILAVDPRSVRVGMAAGKTSGVPRAMRGNEILPVDISLSHDGSWLACAVVPTIA